MQKILMTILSLSLFGCAAAPQISAQAKKVQVLKSDSVLISKCNTIKPITVTRAEVAPAQDVYDNAVLELKELASSAGADAITLSDDHLEPGVKNSITINAIAFKCF